jgi:hypothetical protein
MGIEKGANFELPPRWRHNPHFSRKERARNGAPTVGREATAR